MELTASRSSLPSDELICKYHDLEVFWHAGLYGSAGRCKADTVHQHRNQSGCQQGASLANQAWWGLVCSRAYWAPEFPLMPQQASLFGSGVPLDSRLRGLSLWDLASTLLSQEDLFMILKFGQPGGQDMCQVTGSSAFQALQSSSAAMTTAYPDISQAFTFLCQASWGSEVLPRC